MIQFSISEYNSELCKLCINEQFVKYIKKQNLSHLALDINDWVKIQPTNLSTLDDIKISSNCDYTVELNSTILEKELSDLLQIGNNKKAIILPSEVQFSAEKKLPVLITYRNIDKFQRYWKTGSRAQRFALYELLSQDIIENPYVDDPDDAQTFKGYIAFHVNHGTTHGIRQAELTKHYLQLVETHGNECVSTIARSITNEEYACLELAAFLFRSGRTNELGWEQDKLHGKRTVAIFKQIALELQFDTTLVDLVTLCFDYHSKQEISTSLTNHTLEETKAKIQLFTKVLKLSHESDLVRCFENYEEIKEPIRLELLELLNPTLNSNSVADIFLQYTAEICRQTGAPISTTPLQNEGSTDYKPNTKLSVESTIEPKLTFFRLISVIPEILPGFKAPTKLWYKSDEHIDHDEQAKIIVKAHDKQGHIITVEQGWTKEQMQAIPTDECIKKESEYLSTHACIYHATTKSSYALDLFCRKLKLLADGSNHTAWIRDFHSKPTGVKYNTIQEIQEKMSQNKQVDNSDNNSWHLLSCSPTLWQNSDYESEESTVDYYYSNLSVTKLDFGKIIYTLLDEIGLLVDQEALRLELLNSYMKQACRHFLRNLPGHPSPRKGQKKATSMPPAALDVLVPLDFDPPLGLKICAPQ